MTDTVNLGLPCIEGSQAQKHVTHNEALRILDTLVQLAVDDRDLTAPPATLAEGDRFIVKSGATGLWAGHDHAVAAWQDGAWQFSAPKVGWVAFVADEGTLIVWNGSAWGDFFSTVTSLQNLARLGVGTTADATNPLSAKLNNALFAAKTVAEGGDGNLRYKLSKESAAKTLSFLFQDNWSGRAEIGLIGDDDFSFKVSADGSTWHDGIVIDRGTGAVTFPNTSIAGGGREKLSANRTYYVRTDGSDSNNGLSNTSDGAFLTIQKAIDTVAALDLAIYNATIQIGNGTYTQGLTLKTLIGAGAVTIQGDATTPANVLISVTGNNCFTANNLTGDWRIRGVEMRTTTSGMGIRCSGPTSTVTYGAVRFGTCANQHVAAEFGARVTINENYEISGGSTIHWEATNGIIQAAGGVTVTLTGTPAFSVAFCYLEALSYCRAFAAFSGSATGVRYSVNEGSLIQTGGGGAAYLPGNAAGSVATQGQYL